MSKSLDISNFMDFINDYKATYAQQVGKTKKRLLCTLNGNYEVLHNGVTVLKTSQPNEAVEVYNSIESKTQSEAFDLQKYTRILTKTQPKAFDLQEHTQQVIKAVQEHEGNNKFIAVANLIAEANNKGRKEGYNKAIELSKDAIDSIK